MRYVWVVALLLVGCGQEARVERVSSASPKAAPTPDNRPAIVAFGDSLTAGPGVNDDANYPAVLERGLARKGHHYRVINAGVSGDTTSGGLARVDTVIAYQPKIVILELGANDGLRGLPVEITRANLEQMIARFEQAGAQVVLAGMKLPPNYGPDYIRPFERIFVDLAAKYKTPRIPFLLEGVAARPQLMLADGLHPNAAGHRIVAANVLRIVEPLLK